jgi:hypothetical protein
MDHAQVGSHAFNLVQVLQTPKTFNCYEYRSSANVAVKDSVSIVGRSDEIVGRSGFRGN